MPEAENHTGTFIEENHLWSKALDIMFFLDRTWEFLNLSCLCVVHPQRTWEFLELSWLYTMGTPILKSVCPVCRAQNEHTSPCLNVACT